MRLYNFARLIKKYTVSCKLEIITGGSWQAGVWQGEKTTTQDIKGAVVPITEKRIYSSGGYYKSGDCEFITTEPVVIHNKCFLIHNGEKYKLENSTDYSDYADFNIYVARRVSSFDTTGNDTAGNA